MRKKVLALQLPSPPSVNMIRDRAGGYGIAVKCSRPDYGHSGPSAPYLLLFYGTAILDQNGYDTIIIDSAAEQLSGEETLSRIAASAPDIIFAPIGLPSLKYDLIFLRMISECLPNTKIIAMGTVCKSLYDEILRSEWITALLKENNELIMLDLAEAISAGDNLSQVRGIVYRKDNEIIATENPVPLENLDHLPMIPYHKLPITKYRESFWVSDIPYMPVLHERGCPHQCSAFCPYPYGYGKKPLFRSYKCMIDEIELLYKEYNIKKFYFSSQNLTMIRDNVYDICNEILRRELDIGWVCETRMDSVDSEMLKLMKFAGCEQIHYGLESGDPAMFIAIGKPGCDLDVNSKAVKLAQEAGILVKLMVVIGLPGESWDTIRNTINTIRKLKPNILQVSVLTLYPGTKFYENAKINGKLVTEDWSLYTGFNPIMRTDKLSIDDIKKAYTSVQRSLMKRSIVSKIIHKLNADSFKTFKNRNKN